MIEGLGGIYRIPSVGGIPACVWIEDENGVGFKVSEERYRMNHYEPDLAGLPTEDQYNADEGA